MRVRRTNIAVATLVLTSLAVAPASAQEGPGSSSGADAVGVEGVATVSGTSATTEDGGSADAAVVRLGDQTVVGGSQEGTGSNGGEILTTGETDRGSITVGGWSADVEDDRSSSESSVLTARGSEDEPRIDVARSRSEATSSGSTAETTAARISMGGHTLELLSASSSSEGSGAAYLASIDGQAIGSSEQADGQCQVDADPLARLICLYADAFGGDEDADGEDGTPAGSGVSTGVVDAAVGEGALTGGLFTSTASQLDDGTGTPKPPTGDPEGPEEPEPKPPSGDPVNPAPGGELPVTGGGLATSLFGLAALGSAGALRRFARR